MAMMIFGLLAGCNGGGPDTAPTAGSERPSADVAFRQVQRASVRFDAPAETGGWRVKMDGWPPPSRECDADTYRRAYPSACAPNPGPDDGRFEMVLVQPGDAPLSFSFQAYPTAAEAVTLLDEETARARGGGATVEALVIDGAQAITTRRDHLDIFHHEETVVVFSGHLMLRWKVAGPRAAAATIGAIAGRLVRTIRVAR